MNVPEVVAKLESLGTEPYCRILRNHGANEPVLGVKIAELKPIQKHIKQDYDLSLGLFDTGIYDAQYLAGLIAEPARMTKRDLRHWLAHSNCATIAGTTVASVAAESRYGHEMALAWIQSKKEVAAQTGWATFSGWIALTDDSLLDILELGQWLDHIQQTIHDQPNLVRYTMNQFVIATGTYVAPLTQRATEVGQAMGVVKVDMGNTACKVPYVPDYLAKVKARGVIGKKRKTLRC